MDIVPRLVAAKLSENLKHQFIIENRAGGGGAIGTGFVANSAPDGYTLLATGATFTIAPALYPDLPYDSVRDFMPISLVSKSPFLLLTHPAVPAKTVKELVDWIRANPDGAKELRRQNRAFVFFRIVGLGEDSDAIGAQGLPLTPGRSIAVDKALHVYGTPFFIDAGLPIDSPKASNPFRRLMIAQDTGSAIVGPARADIYWGAGNEAGQIAGRIRQPGRFTMLIPREIDPVEAGAKMPLPLPRPAALIARQTQPKIAPAHTAQDAVSSAASGATGSTKPKPKSKHKQ